MCSSCVCIHTLIEWEFICIAFCYNFYSFSFRGRLHFCCSSSALSSMHFVCIYFIFRFKDVPFFVHLIVLATVIMEIDEYRCKPTSNWKPLHSKRSSTLLLLAICVSFSILLCVACVCTLAKVLNLHSKQVYLLLLFAAKHTRKKELNVYQRFEYVGKSDTQI